MGRKSKKNPLGELLNDETINQSTDTDTDTGSDVDNCADANSDVKPVETEEFVITLGHSLCGTLKGLMKPGDPVDPSCLRDGEVGFKNHRESGTIVTKDEYMNQLKAKAKK